MHSFVTIAHATDFGLLRLQARSMALYCPAKLAGEILIVENFDPGKEMDWRPALLDAYGPLAPAVRFLPAAAVSPVRATHAGWWKQQVLKLAVASVVTCDAYLVLDAKNHLFKPLTLDFLRASDGRPRLNGYGFEHHSLKDALIRTLAYLGVDATPFISHFTRTSTPFLMLRSVAREIVWFVAAREGKPFAEAFLERRLTEFFLYAGYLQMQGKLQSTYDMGQPYCAQIWGFSANEAGCREAIGKASEPKAGPFLAVHRAALEGMDDAARRIVAAFWLATGLFETVEAGVQFSLAPNATDFSTSTY